MIVLDAYGNRHELPDTWDQDFEITLSWLKNWDNARMGTGEKIGRKKKQKTETAWQLLSLGVRPSLPCTICLIRVSRGEMDDDNVPGALKYVRDEIARWMGLDKDRVPGLKWRYGQEKTKRVGFTGVRICIIEHDEQELIA